MGEFQAKAKIIFAHVNEYLYDAKAFVLPITLEPRDAVFVDQWVHACRA